MDLVPTCSAVKLPMGYMESPAEPSELQRTRRVDNMALIFERNSLTWERPELGPIICSSDKDKSETRSYDSTASIHSRNQNCVDSSSCFKSGYALIILDQSGRRDREDGAQSGSSNVRDGPADTYPLAKSPMSSTVHRIQPVYRVRFT